MAGGDFNKDLLGDSSVYFGAAGIKRTRYTIPAALTADLAAYLAAAWAVRLFFET